MGTPFSAGRGDVVSFRERFHYNSKQLFCFSVPTNHIRKWYGDSKHDSQKREKNISLESCCSKRRV